MTISSELAARLRTIVGGSTAARRNLEPENPEPENRERRNQELRNLEPVLGGSWLSYAAGPCFVVERRYPTATFAHVDDVDERVVEAAMLAGGAPARAPFVFFDLETTGLSGGAGTYAFLVGCGWFEAQAFVTRQFLLTSIGAERALLAAVTAEFARAGALVSFNGKSFDAPLLETRYLFHRLEWAAGRLPHVDVLHPARRFWKRETCSLISLEQQVLDMRRTGDVPGFEIPGRYFQFLRSGDARPLADVLEHNRLDLVSLGRLTGRLLHLVRTGPDAVRDAQEALALGHVYVRAGLEARARDSYGGAIAACRAPSGAFDPIRIDALRALAMAWRRARRFDAAAECWRQLTDTRGCPPHIVREASEALAIHHEHRLRDLQQARTFALRCLENDRRSGVTESAERRLARLDRKMGGVRPALLDSHEL